MSTGRHGKESGPDDPTSRMDEEILEGFLSESKEGLQKLELDFVTLEKEPHNTELLNNIFRVIHSMKGAASFLGFKNLTKVSHKAEDVLNKLRNEELSLTPAMMDSLLLASDVIKGLILGIEQDRCDTGADTGDITARLDSFTREVQAECTALPVAIERTPAPGHVPPAREADAATNKKEEIRSIRMDVERLDSLFNLVGELVLSRNRNMQILRLLSRKYPGDDIITSDLSEANSSLDHLTSEIQSAVMKTRMMPVSSVFNKFNRMVRDLGKRTGKEIELHISGEGTEIDKNIIEGISDPLTHIIRNSIDHGIEEPGEREAAGKRRAGRIDLRAYHEGNYVVINITDDGKGISTENVKNKAVEKGIITQAEAEKLSKSSALSLIFAPGFSTAEKISEISGRGVGMDVVKTNVEKLRGNVVISSDTGAGTNIEMRIPLTIAILYTLIVRVSGQRYAVPLSNVVETHRIRYDQIERVRGSMVFRMREELMPLVLLSEIFELPSQYSGDSEFTIVVLKNGPLRIGMVTDATEGQEEVVIKPLDCLGGIAEPYGVSGATILGDGSVTLILDVGHLMRLSKAEERRAEFEGPREIDEPEKNMMDVVMVDNFGKEIYALPSGSVREIELVHDSDIEVLDGKMFYVYRGRAIPVADISAVTKNSPRKDCKSYYVVILTDGQNEKGLLAGRLIGIRKIDGSAINRSGIELLGVPGYSMVNGKLMFLLDPREIISSFSRFSAPWAERPDGVSRAGRKESILIVDDVRTHRSIIEGVVAEAGLKSVTAEDGLDALDKLNGQISLVLTDLEMPNMNGYEFTREAKKRYPHIPIVMVTSMSGEEDKAKGLDAGVDNYIVKWDKESILNEIGKYIQRGGL